jgi:hypothetical protein
MRSVFQHAVRRRRTSGSTNGAGERLPRLVACGRRGAVRLRLHADD